MKILITAFDTFNPPQNVSEVIVNEFAKQNKNLGVATKTLSCNSVKIPQYVAEFFTEVPELIILCGETANRTIPCLEQFALNVCDFGIPDNEGLTLKNTAICHDGPPAYQTNFLYLNELISFIQTEIGKELNISHHAGTFLCNQVYYETLNYVSKKKLSTQVFFLHLPKSALSKNTGFNIKNGVELLSKMVDFFFQVQVT